MIAIVDAHLEAAVREAIGKPEGAIRSSDVAELTALSASGGVRDLTGINQLPQLTELVLEDNQISDIGL